MLSGEAFKKSLNNGFTKEEHFAASERIKELYEKSIFYIMEKARRESKDIKGYPKYITKINLNGKNAQAFLTLEELIEHGNKIYSLELQELHPLH